VRAAAFLLVAVSGCAGLSPEVGCLEAEAGSGTRCPPEAAVVDAAPDGGVEAGLEAAMPAEAGKTEAGRDARD
jgi:hypothetical protein